MQVFRSKTITQYRLGQSTFYSCDQTSGQRKHHRTRAPKDKNQSGQKPQNRKQFNTPTIKLYNPISVHEITWYRCAQFKFCSYDQVVGQRKSPMDKKHHRTKAPRIKINADKSPANPENILILHKSRCTIPFLFM